MLAFCSHMIKLCHVFAFRVWWTWWKNLPKWSLATWQQVENMYLFSRELGMFLAIVYTRYSSCLVFVLVLKRCASIQHCSWDLHGWFNRETICFFLAMHPMKLNHSDSHSCMFLSIATLWILLFNFHHV